MVTEVELQDLAVYILDPETYRIQRKRRKVGTFSFHLSATRTYLNCKDVVLICEVSQVYTLTVVSISGLRETLQRVSETHGSSTLFLEVLTRVLTM